MTWVFGTAGEDARALAWPLLETAVKRCWGWTALPETARSDRGKPFFPRYDDRWFSLSHSGGLALCALSDDGPVGVDIEALRPRDPILFDYALSEGERARCKEDWGEFYRLWTLKESWCKREDAPLYPPRKVVTPPACPHRSYEGEAWRAAVCCTGAPPERICWLP